MPERNVSFNQKCVLILFWHIYASISIVSAYVILSTSGAGIDAYYFLEVAGRMGLLQTGEYAVLIAYPPNLSTISGVQATFDGSMNPKSGDFPLGNCLFRPRTKGNSIVIFFL